MILSNYTPGKMYFLRYQQFNKQTSTSSYLIEVFDIKSL